jgi:multidrug efflux pump subunit AcrA (membrane-fusion protein)
MSHTPDSRAGEKSGATKETKTETRTTVAAGDSVRTTSETVESYSRRPRGLTPTAIVVVIALLALALAAFLFLRGRGASGEEEAKPIVEVEVATPERAEMREYVEATGTLNAMPGHEASFSAATNGRATRVLVQVGQHVRAGQTLAELDKGVLAATVRQQAAAVQQASAQAQQARATSGSQSPIATDQIRQAETALATARANQTQAQNELTRQQTLFDHGIAARKDVEAARTQVAVTNAAVTQGESSLAAARVNAARGLGEARTQTAVTAGGVSAAQAALQVAQAELSRARIVAPISGTVTKRAVNDGETVDPATPAFEVIDSSSLDLVANLPAQYLGRIKTGDLTIVKVEPFPEREFEGGVVQVAPAVDPQTNTVALRVRLPNPTGELKAGLFADAKIAVEIHANALVVPEAALVVEGDETSVFVTKADETVEKRKVTIGIRDSGRAEITEGLNDGERVVTTGAFGLDDKSKIKIVEPAAEGDEEKGGAGKDEKDTQDQKSAKDQTDEKGAADEKNINGAKGDKNANDAKGASKTPAGDKKE